jgi:hypothetical protein
MWIGWIEFDLLLGDVQRHVAEEHPEVTLLSARHGLVSSAD